PQQHQAPQARCPSADAVTLQQTGRRGNNEVRQRANIGITPGLSADNGLLLDQVPERVDTMETARCGVGNNGAPIHINFNSNRTVNRLLDYTKTIHNRSEERRVGKESRSRWTSDADKR